MRISSTRLWAAIMIIGTLRIACAQLCDPVKMPDNACSYEALNGNCTVLINRFNPITPPTIYARRGSTITVTLVNPSPFEQLHWDRKSESPQPPPDQFYNGFTTLTTALGALELVEPVSVEGVPPPANNPQFTIPALKPQPPTVAQIAAKQHDLADSIKEQLGKDNPLQTAQDALQLIKIAEQPLPSDVCGHDDPSSFPYRYTSRWKKDVDNSLSAALNIYSDEIVKGPNGYTDQIKRLDQQIENLELDGKAGSPEQFAALGDNQQALKTAVASIIQLNTEFHDLQTTVDSIQDSPADPNYEIIDHGPDDRNDDTQAWNIDYTNTLAPVAKRVAGATYVAPNTAALTGLGDPPATTTITTVTVQFQPPNRYEISSGLLVPFKAYHSYAAAQSYNSTTPVVQQNKIFTVIPMADVNILLGHEWVAHQQRMAAFATVGVGYCPATTSVAFGVGPSLSWRSIVFNPMLDIGRDAQLAPGFTVGQPLGSSSNTTPAAAPVTSNGWVIYPAMGISVRIPLGGAGH